MKKVLMGTTAVAALGLASNPAAAAETSGKISLSVGGYYQNFISFVDQRENGVSPTNDFNQVNVRQEGEIQFRGETTLDNGLTVGFRSEFEAVEQSATGNNPTDEIYVYFEGGWGRLVLGADDTAPGDMQYAAPSAGLDVNSPNFYLFTLSGTAPNGGYLGKLTGDSNEVKYFTPRFYGFQFGVSYVPNIDNSNGDRQSGGLVTDDDNDDFHNIIAVGVNYENTFGDVGVNISGGWERYDREEDSLNFTDDRQDWAFGASFTYAGFTLGGGYFQSNGTNFDAAIVDSNEVQNYWVVGLRYDPPSSAWAVSFEWGQGEQELGPSSSDNLNQFELGASYKASPGVTFVGAFQYFFEENDSGAVDADGWGIVAGTKLTF